MSLVKRIIWLFFYIPAVMKTRISLTFMSLKMFFSRALAWPRAIYAGLKAGGRAAYKALRGGTKTS